MSQSGCKPKLLANMSALPFSDPQSVSMAAFLPSIPQASCHQNCLQTNSMQSNHHACCVDACRSDIGTTHSRNVEAQEDGTSSCCLPKLETPVRYSEEPQVVHIHDACGRPSVVSDSTEPPSFIKIHCKGDVECKLMQSPMPEGRFDCQSFLPGLNNQQHGDHW